MFSTHPPIPDRIARLRNLGGIALSEPQTPLAPPPPLAAPDVPNVETHTHGPWDSDATADTTPPQPPPIKGPWG
jgi:hypothetical protein